MTTAAAKVTIAGVAPAATISARAFDRSTAAVASCATQPTVASTSCILAIASTNVVDQVVDGLQFGVAGQDPGCHAARGQDAGCRTARAAVPGIAPVSSDAAIAASAASA